MDEAQHTTRRIRLAKSTEHVVRVVNSPLSIFLLSSVLLSLVTERHAELEARNARAAVIRAERARLVTELALRTGEIQARVSELREAVEGRGVPIAVLCRDRLPNPTSAAAVDPEAPAEREPWLRLQAAVSGAAPYMASSPTYERVHALVLLIQTDENRDDRLSEGLMQWSDPDQTRPEPPFNPRGAVAGLRSKGICTLLNSSRQLGVYYTAVTRGQCESGGKGRPTQCRPAATQR